MSGTRMIVLLLLAVLAAAPLAAATLAREGQARAVIGLSANSDPSEALAARELTEYVRKMSGASLNTETVGNVEAFLAAAKARGLAAVVLGRPALPKVQAALGARADVRGAFALQVTDDAVLAAGNGEGVYYAVLELLEGLGCRWFLPGELGEVIPALKTLAVTPRTVVQAPSFPSRWFQMPNPEWQARLRCGGDTFPSAHGLPQPKVTVDAQTGAIAPAEYADFFSLRNGKRVLSQHCVSSPRFVAYVVAQVKAMRQAGRGPVIGMGPNDGGGFCECANCRALDTGDADPFSNAVSVTDRYIWFFNQVLKGVEDEYPDTKLAFYVYANYMRPPKREKPDPRIVGALAPIALDRVHSFLNPISPERGYAKWLYAEWGKIMPELYDRGYGSNLADPGFVFNITSRMRDEIPACQTLGVKGWRVETFPNYASQFPATYIAGKLMWNHAADVDALLADCYAKFFGPAAKPMGDYLTLMDAALRDGDYNTGSAWDIPQFYPPALRRQARALLDRGRALAAGSGIYEARVKMITRAFDMTEAFIAMQEARTRVDLAAAKAALDRCDAAANELMAWKPVPMQGAGRASTYINYMNRFFRPCTEQGYARVTGGNRLAAAAGDAWDFQIDPQQVGEDLGWWRPETAGGNWQRLHTSSLSWGDQGLRYFKGLAWYRQAVTVPAEFAGKRLFLWCGGVDETAKVWINGRLIGISPGASFYPFEMDASEAVQPGKNVIVVCVANLVVNELGTGGIVAPVFLYAPKDGAAAKLENIRDLKPTFP